MKNQKHCYFIYLSEEGIKDARRIIQTYDHESRLNLILELSSDPNLTPNSGLFLNELILFENHSILSKSGQKFDVKSGVTKGAIYPRDACYANAANKMLEEGYGYVEGYVIRKEFGCKANHAWNVDKDGNHIDFTFVDAECYEYYGIIIPNEKVIEVGYNNGCIWYATLPFLKAA